MEYQCGGDFRLTSNGVRRTLAAIPTTLLEMGHPLASETSNPVSELLVRWRNGDDSALNNLLPLVYAELRKLAGHYLRSERPDHTLQGTALVHETKTPASGRTIRAT
jgi:hypothetical protein